MAYPVWTATLWVSDCLPVPLNISPVLMLTNRMISGRAYPQFEQMTNYIKSSDVNDLLPVSLSSGTGRDVIIPANQPDLPTVTTKIRDICVEMGLVTI